MIDQENLPDIICGGKAKCQHPDGWAFVDDGPWNDDFQNGSDDSEVDGEEGKKVSDIYEQLSTPSGKKWRRPEWQMMT